VVLKPSFEEAKRLRADIHGVLKHEKRIEIWCWKGVDFMEWLYALGEKTEIYGEAAEKSFNLVVNNRPCAVDLMEV